jgi:hypothetical protein
MVEVRNFRPEDADEVSALAQVAWNHTYRAIYSQPTSQNLWIGFIPQRRFGRHFPRWSEVMPNFRLRLIPGVSSSGFAMSVGTQAGTWSFTVSICTPW